MAGDHMVGDRWLRALLPAGCVVTEVVPRTGGGLSEVFEVRLAGSPPLIVKRYAEQWRWKQAKEEHLYRLLAEHGIESLPRVVHADRDLAATVLTLVPGRPMSEAELTDDAAFEAYREMGRFLAGIHRITMPAFGYLTDEIVDPLPDNARYMRRQFAKKLAEFTALGGEPDVRDAARARVRAGAHLFACCPGAVLCHNDLHEGNVLVDESGRVRGVVDIENMIAADPLIDLAKTLQYDLSGSARHREGLLEGYGALPADGAERLRLYQLYHAVELWDWFAATGQGAPLARIADDIRALAAG